MARAILCTISAPLLLLAACGDTGAAPANGSAQSASPNGAVRACDVLTQADAEKALGRPVQRLANDGGPAGLDICQYGYQGERIMDAGNVSLTLQPVDIASVRAGVIAAGETPQPVEGLGDSAFWTNSGLYVGKGNRTGIYLLGAGGMADPKAASIALARATSTRF